MNIQELVKSEVAKVLTDAENSPIGAALKEFFDQQIERVKSELKTFVDAELAKFTNQNPPPQQ